MNVGWYIILTRELSISRRFVSDGPSSNPFEMRSCLLEKFRVSMRRNMTSNKQRQIISTSTYYVTTGTDAWYKIAIFTYIPYNHLLYGISVMRREKDRLLPKSTINGSF